MNLLSWLIVIIPLIFILGAAYYSKRYIRDITDYLASGRVAGRYVISVGDLSSALSVITIVALCENQYLTGMAMGFWMLLLAPTWMLMSLSGYCTYRFRETSCLSAGQFLELRYSRNFRIVACAVRAGAEMVTNAIGPAVAVRFFIYFIGLPFSFQIVGVDISTYTILVIFLLTCALFIILPAGRISLLITDSFQGIISYPIFVIFTVFVLTNVSWFGDVAPVMIDRIPGESFINPYDVSGLRDFNVFALVVTMMGSILNRAAWIGNDTSSSGRTAHEQKMAGILGSWRNGFSTTMVMLIGCYVITVMLGSRFADESHQVRIALSQKVAEEVILDPILYDKTLVALNTLPVERHDIGVDKPYSRKENPDKAFLDAVHETLLAGEENEGIANATYQKFSSLYSQMMMPVLLGSSFPPILMGLFALLMVMLLLSTDDSRIFNASSSIIQDLILPFRNSPVSTKEHLMLLKLCSVGVAIFFFIVSMFFAQLDYIIMFITIMSAVWLGSAGPIMVGGLYTRFGTTGGAWACLSVGSGIPILGLLCQRNWADHVYPWLLKYEYVESVSWILKIVSKPLNPYVVWEMNPVKFPINSMEIYFISMCAGMLAYCLGSYLTQKELFNLDRMLHRGIYAAKNTPKPIKSKLSFKVILDKILGIDMNYTKGDKIIAWSVVWWVLIYNFIIMFCGVVIWNAISPWTNDQWSLYFFIISVLSAIIVGIISTVWFVIGGVIDIKALFRDLANRVANPLDNGQVVGHVSLCDVEHFNEIEHEHEHDPNVSPKI
jgi:solute:Na+ symporter, SSS family